MSIWERFKRRYIGDKTFYRLVLTIVVPIIVQNSISNFVNLLDNIMVGQVGTDQMSGVAIANQLIFVFNLCVFGALSGADIYGAQFFGAKDLEGVRHTFRFKLICMLLLLAGSFFVLLTYGENLLKLYLTGDSGAGDAELTLRCGLEYLRIILISIPAFGMTQIYAGTLRVCGETLLPMKAGLFAVLTNFVLNYLLIFGVGGVIPAMGTAGAAIATVTSRYVELGYILLKTKRQRKRYAFLDGVYKTLRIPKALAASILKRGMPLFINEGMWSAGMAALTQQYSLRGLTVVAALNISSTIANLFNTVFLAMGNAIAVLAGQALGARDNERAKSTVSKVMATSVSSCFVMGGLLILFAPLVPRLYNTEQSVRDLATMFMITAACCMPINAYAHCCYFTLRSGGRTIITFLFDSFFTWVVCVSSAYALANYTSLPITTIYPIVTSLELIKCIAGGILVHKGVWINNIVD